MSRTSSSDSFKVFCASIMRSARLRIYNSLKKRHPSPRCLWELGLIENSIVLPRAYQSAREKEITVRDFARYLQTIDLVKKVHCKFYVYVLLSAVNCRTYQSR